MAESDQKLQWRTARFEQKGADFYFTCRIKTRLHKIAAGNSANQPQSFCGMTERTWTLKKPSLSVHVLSVIPQND